MILKTLISMLRCVWLGLDLNSAGMVQIWESLVYSLEDHLRNALCFLSIQCKSIGSKVVWLPNFLQSIFFCAHYERKHWDLRAVIITVIDSSALCVFMLTSGSQGKLSFTSSMRDWSSVFQRASRSSCRCIVGILIKANGAVQWFQ